MKSCKKIIISALLSVVMLFSVCIPHAYAGIGDFLLGMALSFVQSAQANTAQIEAAQYALRHSWESDTYSSSSHLREVSGDDLWGMVSSLNSNGCPCKIIYTSSVGGTGVSGYWIECTGEPFYINRSAYSRIDGTTLYTGKHLGLFGYSATFETDVYFYSKYMNSSYYLNQIYSRIDSIWNWGQPGGVLSNINNSATIIVNQLTSANSLLINTISTIGGYVDNLEGYVDQIEGYIDTVEGKLADISTNTGFIDDIYNDVKTGTWVTSYNSYSDGTSYPTVTINDQIANNLVAYLNANLMGKEVRYLARGTNNSQLSAVRYFDYAYINSSNQIRVRVLYPDGTYQNYYLVSPDHTLILSSPYKSSNDIFSVIDSINTQLTNITGSGNTTNIKTTLIGFGANIEGTFTGIAQGIANLDANLAAFANINGTIGSLFSVFGGLFDDLIDSVNASTADLSNLESYTDGIEGLLTNNQSALVQSLDTDGIWLNNNAGTLNNMDSIMISPSTAESMIATINSGRSGDLAYFYNGMYSSSYRPMISYAYLGDDNRIRVYARNSSNNNSNMTLVTPDGKKYIVDQSLVSDVSDYLHVMIDNVDYSVAQLNALTASNTKEIHEWLQGTDLSNLTVITDLIQNYGNNVTVAVLRSNKLLQLYNEALLSHFRDINDLKWNNIFAYFYMFNEGDNVA